MPKRIVFFFIGFVILASLAYYGFNRWKGSREKVDLWTLVPDDAALVLETQNHQELMEHLQETELWQSFSLLPFAQRFEEDMAYLDSISPGSQRLTRFLNEKNILTSLHVTGKTEVAFVFYVPVSSVGEHRFLRTLSENINKSDIFEEDSRDYQGMLLTDIKNNRNGRSFTYFTYHNNIILSESPVLVEEIVRRITRGKPKSIAAEFQNTNYLNQPEVYANVFVNYRALPDLLGLFLEEKLMPEVRYLSTLCQNGMLELKLERNKIFLNGFSTPELLKNSLHREMEPQKPQPLGVRAYLPNRTAMLLHFGLQEIERLRQQQATNKSVYAATLDSLAQTLSDEAALAYMESSSVSQSPEKVAYAHMANPALAQRLLDKLSAQVAGAKKQKPFVEKYGSYTIQLVNVPDLPQQLLGRVFQGFEQSYVVQVDDYLLIAEEMTTLRQLLDDISDENVWGKSVAQKAFLEETLQEANLSLFLNTVNAWYLLNRYTTDEDRENLLQNATLIKRFSQVSLQFSIVEGRYYTSLVIRRPDQSKATGQQAFEEEKSIVFDKRLDTRPFPVQNAVDRSREVVVQDSANVLINVTASGQRGWVDSVGTSLRSGIKQIEYGPDKKLRFLFITANRIHAVNNQGQSLENFPFNVPDSLSLQHLAVFDYENNGNYRLLVDDNMGNLYMYNMQGAAVQGWQPRRMDYRLAAEPQHLRVGGRDVILVLLENGYVYALNREGETYPGFPINLKSPLTSGAVAKVGADLKRTEVTAVTRYGSVITFNLQGRVLNREQLLRPSKRAMFELVPESSNGRSFIIVRQEQGKVAVFDQDLKEVFEKRYVTSASKIVQYFHFGGDHKVYAITETGPQKTYLYNAEGSLIGNRTLENNQPVTIYYNETANNYTLYLTSGKQLKKMQFRVGE
ncbi:hypothetical protein [Pontibacter actiniarum]|uniref:DUF3352 domain-containing protein n=1 Tax=Pontibacter actiniarum TaxID=323450 RepID=A0A1X9YMB7_9BACT|nr:hypothetical protein [Pontibacter actiniarum]ARS33991.1 hypothetical protein CA264_00250 [Pontibacter actiniarum]